MRIIDQAGTYKLGDRHVRRLGYGAMQLAGPGVYGPPRDHDAALAVLRDGGGGRRRPHRHQRLLRSPRHQPADPRGAVALSRRSRHRHQGRRQPRRGRVVESGTGAGAASLGSRGQPSQPRPRSAGGRQLPHSSRPPRPRRSLDRRELRGDGRDAARGPDPPLGRQQRDPHAGRRGARHRADRLRAEPVQPRPPRGRRDDRRAGGRRHRLCAVFSRSAASVRCSRRRSPRRPTGSAPRRCRWRSPGCSGARPTSC